MKALVKTCPGPGLELRELPEPSPGPGEVQIRVAVAAVCGSDVARYVWTRNYQRGQPKDMTRDLPRVLGHEFSGIVSATGPGVSGVRVGDPVAVRNILSCGSCPACRSDHRNVCPDRRTIGVQVDGGYAELSVVPAANCSVLPAGLDLHLAAGMQPFAVGTHALSKAALEPGARIAVWGLGPVGAAISLAARAQGVATAVGFDRIPERVEQAAAAGIPAVLATDPDPGRQLAAAGGPRSFDAFFDAAGAAGSILTGLGYLARRAPVVLVGNLAAAVTADLMPLVLDEQRLVGSRSYSLRSWDVALRTIGGSGFRTVLGDEVGIGEAIARFETAAAGSGSAFGVLPNPELSG